MNRDARMGAAAALLTAIAQPAAAEPLQPTANWVVNFDAAQCVASRAYGSADKPTTLVLKAPVTGGVIQLMVLREGTWPKGAEQVNGSLRFAGGPRQKVTALAYSPAGVKRRVVTYNLPRQTVASWPTSGMLALDADLSLRTELQVNGLQPLLKVMDECTADLANYWNFAPEGAPPKVARNPQRSPLQPIFGSDDYPLVALRQHQVGTVGAVLLIDEQGKVADCTLVESSGAAALDAQSCAIIKTRARYSPALGLNGKPARSIDFARINWKI